MLDLDSSSQAELKVPMVEWAVDDRGVSSAPIGSIPVDISKLTEDDIRKFRYHLGGAGFETSRINVIDGYSVDLDDDNQQEAVLRVILDGIEVVLILDTDEKLGNRAFIYSTEHAFNGKNEAGLEIPSALPFAIKVDDQILFCWSGMEDEKPYLEIVYSQDGSFVIFE
jgi:hypothetical protein